MASRGQNASASIYAIIKTFGVFEWKEFARTYLELPASDIEDIEYAYPKDLKEQKYQMVQAWQRRKGRGANVQRLQELVATFRGPVVSSGPQHTVTTPIDDAPAPTFPNPSRGQGSTSGSALAQGQTAVTLGSSPHSQRHETAQQQQLTANKSQNHSSPHSSTPQNARAFIGDGATNKPKEKDNNANNLRAPEAGEPAEPRLQEAASASGSNNLHGTAATAKDGKNSHVLKRLLSFKSMKKTRHPRDPHEHKYFCDRVEKVRVQHTTADKYEDHRNNDADIYQITKHPKGCALILNNSFKGNKMLERLGSNMDVKHMKKLWKNFGCQIHKKEPQCEKTANQMKDLIKEMARTGEKYDFIVIVIMTHGSTDAETKEQYFLGSDGGKVMVKEVLEWFHNTRTRNMHDVPKFFIFQFCRGQTVDSGVVTDSGDHSADDGFHDHFEVALKQLLTNSPIPHGVAVDSVDGVLPSISDILVAYATHEDHAALRDEKEGSWFINAITNVFMKYAKDDHVADLLTKVHASMKAKTGVIIHKNKHGEEIGRSNCKAMSNHQTSLSKKLFLFPGFPN